MPALARGLKATRDAIERLASDPDVVFILKVKEQQFQDAINAALGVELSAVAQSPSHRRSEFGPVVPGQTFDVRTSLEHAWSYLRPLGAAWSLVSPPAGTIAPGPAGPGPGSDVGRSLQRDGARRRAAVASVFHARRNFSESRTRSPTRRSCIGPPAAPALVASARYSVEGVSVEAREPVTRLEPNLPYGDEIRELMVLPALAVNVTPQRAIVSLARLRHSPSPLRVEVVNNQAGAGHRRRDARDAGELDGDTAVTARFRSIAPANATTYSSRCAIPALDDREYAIRAVATADGRPFREGYDVIQHRDLETRYLFKDAVSRIRGVDVQVAPNLSVGYVMGIGDDVPSAISQLGARVQLLSESDLANGNLQSFDAIMTGTRAYAVRDDLRTYNQRLLDYVKDGGNLIVLYNTQEYVPGTYAPYPGQLTARAEEVSEEDSPVQILQSAHPVFNVPNRITKADFDGWVEQRGSKFWSAWDTAYTPMIETHDRGQDPQRGGWLWARYGKGHYTYFAYAFHRQLPYAVPGAYRLLANVLSLGKTAPADGARLAK